MTTLAALADLAQVQLSDSGAGSWAQATVEGFALDAIREYTKSFHRVREQTIDCVADTHEYSLAADFVAVLSVEYPVGEDPPEYLTRRDHLFDDFYDSDSYFDVQRTRDTNQATLIISDTPADATDDIKVTYEAYHDHALTSTDAITVPDDHIDILIKGVVWRALSERLAAEVQNPDTSLYLVKQYRLSVLDAERTFQSAIRDAQSAQIEGGYTRSWKMDDYDRIY
jgi:hypothetical protein